MNQLPQHHSAHQQEKVSILKLALMLPQDLFILRAEDGRDYGVDRILEVIHNGVATNVRSHIQVKSIKSSQLGKASFKYPVPVKTINYLLNTLNSMFVLYSVADDIFYWDWTRQIALAADERGVNLGATKQKTLTFEFRKIITPEAFWEIHKKLLEDSSTLRRIGLDRGSLKKSFAPKEDSPALYSEMLLLYLQQKYEAVIGLSRGASIDDVGASNLVALSYYYTRNYGEALKENARTLAKAPSDMQARRTLATILCEKGIEERNAAALHRAKQTMLEIDRDEWDWEDFYNYGNIVSALGEYGEALSYYERALEVSPNEAMVWKNMATCYFYEKDNQRGLECLDRALELNGNLVEALVSKANVVRDIYSDPQQAVNLLKKALELSEGDYFDSSGINYWLAKSLSDLGEPEEALAVVAEGLSLHPGHEALEEMRLTILMKHWREKEELREEATNSLRALIEKHPKAFPLRTELAQIYLDQDKSGEAYSLIIETFRELNFESPDGVLARFPVADLAFLMARLGPYLEFRAKNGIGADFFANFDVGVELVQKIELVFAIRFARLVDIIVPDRPPDALFEDIERYIAEFSLMNEICSELIAEGYKDSPLDQQVEIVTALVASLPEIVLRELTRQIAWLLNKAGYGATTIDRMIRESERIAKWFEETLEPALRGAHNAIPWTERGDDTQR